MAGKKGKKSTKAEAEAGAANLQKWKQENPAGGNLKHGRYSSTARKRYSDLRTTEGRALMAVITDIKSDIGPNLNAMQSILIERIREKLIVLMQVGKYVDQQASIVNKDGTLITVLGRNYTAYSEALRRDLVALYDTSYKKPSRVPSINDIIEASDGHNPGDK